MNRKQYYTRSGKRILRVQQSMSSCRYRIVSVAADKSNSEWIGGAVKTSWSGVYTSREAAQAQLDAYATEHGLMEVIV